MTRPEPGYLVSAVRAGAGWLCALEAACELIISTGLLHRDDFTRFIRAETPGTEGDWQAVVTGCGTGQLPCSVGERRMLELAASLAGHRPVILGDAVPGLDKRSVQILVRTVLHASGQGQFL